MAFRKYITQCELKKVINYNPNSGEFKWMSPPTSWIKIGQLAGCIARRNNNNYISITINQRPYLAHRLAWLYTYGAFPRYGIDHINKNGLDNRIQNLRDIPQRLNSKNCKLSISNTSGINGVYWYKKTKRWQAAIKVNYKLMCLGYFKNKDAAIIRRLAAELKYGFFGSHGKG